MTTNLYKPLSLTIIILISFMIGFYVSDSLEAEDFGIDESFKQTKLQPSTYFGSEMGKFSSPNGLVELKNKQDGNVVWLNSKQGDKFEVWTMDKGSMRPTISDDSLVVISLKFEKEDIKVGDILALNDEVYNNGSRMSDEDLEHGVVHRLISVERINEVTYYITKGDNNQNVDRRRWVYEDIYGEIVGIIY